MLAKALRSFYQTRKLRTNTVRMHGKKSERTAQKKAGVDARRMKKTKKYKRKSSSKARSKSN